MTRVVLVTILALVAVPAATFAQNQTGRLTVTVNDTTGGSLPTATVTVTGLEPANRAAKIAPRQTATSASSSSTRSRRDAMPWWPSSQVSKPRRRARSACVPATTS